MLAPATGFLLAVMGCGSSPSTAVDAAIDAPAPASLQIDPPTKLFDDVIVLARGDATTFTITNLGDVESGAITAALGGQGASSFELASHCAGPLAPNASCTIDLTFAPTAVGLAAATLDVSGSGTISAPLQGLGIARSPIAVADSVTVVEDSSATAIDVLANDTNVDGAQKLVAATTQPAAGVVVIASGGTGVTYQPNENACGSDSFMYTVSGGATATVSVTITCVDDLPTAIADTATVTEDSGATAIAVLANDTDIDAGPQTITATSTASHGTVVITGGGTGLTYQPAANYCNNPPTVAADVFTYTLDGGGAPQTATVTVTVTCIDDAPVAVADSASILKDSGATAVNVLANDTDVDGGGKAIATITQPAHGTVAITGGGTGLTYMPTASYCNDATVDTFSYQLTPGTSQATVSITVMCSPPPMIAFVKTQRDVTTNPAGPFTHNVINASVGDLIGYRLTVTNTGVTPCTTILISDPKCSLSGSGGALAVGSTQTFTCSHVLTAGDLGTYTNTATATCTSAGAPVSATDSAVAMVQ